MTSPFPTATERTLEQYLITGKYKYRKSLRWVVHIKRLHVNTLFVLCNDPDVAHEYLIHQDCISFSKFLRAGSVGCFIFAVDGNLYAYGLCCVLGQQNENEYQSCYI